MSWFALFRLLTAQGKIIVKWDYWSSSWLGTCLASTGNLSQCLAAQFIAAYIRGLTVIVVIVIIIIRLLTCISWVSLMLSLRSGFPSSGGAGLDVELMFSSTCPVGSSNAASSTSESDNLRSSTLGRELDSLLKEETNSNSSRQVYWDYLWEIKKLFWEKNQVQI